MRLAITEDLLGSADKSLFKMEPDALSLDAHVGSDTWMGTGLVFWVSGGGV